jgi:pimeloyl-ACP methyl ester carboxylesterase
LIIWGAKDTVLPAADADRFKADIRGSRVVILPEVGHLPQEEAPEETYAAIATFIAEVA